MSQGNAYLTMFKLLVLIPYYLLKTHFLEPSPAPTKIKNVGIFHIPAESNGGGEKVLWAMVDKLIKEDYNVTVYSNYINDKKALMANVKKYFGYDIKLSHFQFLELDTAILTDDRRDFWTEMPGTLACFMEGLLRFKPDLIVESATRHFGYFAYPILAPNIPRINYVHWPYAGDREVSREKQDMQDSNKDFFTRISALNSYIVKQLFVNLPYSLLSYTLQTCYTNSRWTQDHIENSWGKGKCSILYPPCNVEEFMTPPTTPRKKKVVSFSQYRGEKRQDIQLDMWRHFLKSHPNTDVEYHMMGSVKDSGSEHIYNFVKDTIEKEGIKNFFLHRNLPFEQLKKNLQEATFGVHTMHDEHFGIAPAEMLSAGLIVLAHNSAGPKNDIIGNGTHAIHGYLADGHEKFVTMLTELIDNYYAGGDKKQEMIDRVKRGQKFAKEELSNQAFENKFFQAVKNIEKELEKKAREIKSKQKQNSKLNPDL